MFSVDKMHFEISERKMILRLFDVLFVLTALYATGKVFAFDYFEVSATNYYWTIVLAVYLNVFGAIFEMYNLQVASNEFQVLKSTLITVSTTVLVYLLTPFFSPELPSNRLQILLFFLVVFLSLFFWRMLYVTFLASNRFFQKAILICDQEQVQELILGLENIDPHYKIIGFVNLDSSEQQMEEYHYVQHIKREDLFSFVNENGVSEIVIASQKTGGITADLYQQLLHLLEAGNIIREYTQVYESKTQRIPVQYMSRDFYRFFPFSRSNQNKLYLIVMRIFEITVSLSGLVVGVFLCPLILLGNAIGNKGSLFYSQERIGKDGAVFKILKFRTMVKNAESNGAVFTATNDSRVTLFGKFLRKTRIDEFPQVINILKGDMAFIGPRPERPIFVKEIAEIMPFYETRHIIKPGLTGWAQVNYTYGETIDDSLIKLQYDLYYIKHRSIYLDLNIAFKTITTVLFYRGQ
ncbi:exopolysaccharide biosynthesis polyprenyl glycosylphosphotransferase [Flavobacterium sp. GSP27]|uniref:exopolysaccharide biosynthesis polyprenyl glycosylphosphotransferase n=1 Tax=unclassified Flavobacterium TaxID=196869 RepID=UPI000F82758E|nr:MULTISPECIES: exopolysaccharide biosynthesis polyprenyl glycosylphosphotransferase [unclassified Flavobacterium]RTY72858.1 exopolysaccharide biosynthesis polyprenyl glycosylphosphotransferase [Flavobacterium sp. LS1R10]RTY95454.1 exopolysaccharide biosynthesis polyprenyl glycosylphosphotransferase [Flavobacterium sp. GSN2]RTZ09426.1 exopolysaccharide biosynthesis polyprenyl glycosylphosphotransferase [Flavobacterium sp. GSP27]